LIVLKHFRYIEALRYGVMSRKAMKRGDQKERRQFYQLYIYEDADITLLRLVESYTEAAPQLLLQIYIVLNATRKNQLRCKYLLFVAIDSCVFIPYDYFGHKTVNPSLHFWENSELIFVLFLWHLVSTE